MDLLQTTDAYKRHIGQGLPFFSKKELNHIIGKYKDGMTWDDINRELIKKSMIVKKPTFRQYCQRKWLPPAIKDPTHLIKGKALRYPSTIIGHINFVKYFLYADRKLISMLEKRLKDQEMDVKCSIEDELTYFGVSNGDIELAVGYYLSGALTDIKGAINEHFKKHPDNQLKKETMIRLKKITDKYRKHINPEINSFLSFLEKNTYSWTAGEDFGQ